MPPTDRGGNTGLRSGGLDTEDLDDPYPSYARLRREGPLCRGAPRQWLVTRYSEVAALLRDRHLGHRFSDSYHQIAFGEKPLREFFQRILLFHDPPEHQRLRRFLATGVRPLLSRPPAECIATLVDELLEPALDRGYLDAVSDLAVPLPMRLLCKLFGFPPEDLALIQSLTLDLGKAFKTQPAGPDRAAASAALDSLREYFGWRLAARPKSGSGDVLSRLVAAADSDGALTHRVVVDNALFLLFAGFETTVNLIASATAELIGHPDQLRRVRGNIELVPTAVEEVLRYDAPIQSVARVARSSMEIAGRYVMRGRILILLIGSANRDERQFSSPDRFDVGRYPNPHLSFGGGIHQCLGAPIARVQASVALERLLLRSAAIEPAGEIVRLPAAGDRAYRRVPIRIKPV